MLDRFAEITACLVGQPVEGLREDGGRGIDEAAHDGVPW